jgi:GTP-binding protein Era
MTTMSDPNIFDYDPNDRSGFLDVEAFFAQGGPEEPAVEPPAAEVPDGFRSGFVTIVGRPNVGKSALLNRILGEKVSIVTNKPHTTRFAIRGVYNRPDAQIVFVDTPGIHKPHNAAGEHINAAALTEIDDLDVACFVLDATSEIGKGDRFIAQRVGPGAVIVLNKIDKVTGPKLLHQLTIASEFAGVEYFPVSARTGEGVEPLVEYLVGRLPLGPQFFPPDMVTDMAEAVWVAELVREQLMARMREELPHSVATRVTEWEWPRVRCEIIVERESQKGMVIGRGGQILKEVGTAARESFPGMHLELFVRVANDWQRRPELFSRLNLNPGN